MDKRKFRWRGFVSLFALLLMIAIAFSGVVLYFSPQGRIAHWTQWTFLGFLKDDWTALHLLTTYVFLVALGFHIYYNWKTLLSYLRKKAREALAMTREIALATAVTAAMVVVSFASAPPASWVVELGEYFTESWATPQTKPPAPHAEEWTLAKTAKYIGITVAEAQARLEAKGMTASDKDAKLIEIAEANDSKPNLVFKALGGKKKPSK
jgi:flagellin-like protein